MRLLVIFGIIALSSYMARAGDFDIPRVSVSGTALTQTAPDLLRWSLSVGSRGADIAPLAEKHAATVGAVIAFLKQMGIAAADVQSSSDELAEHVEYRNNTQVRDGYRASTEIQFTQRDQTQYRDLWIGLAKIAGVSVSDTTWDTSKRIELQERTRLEAVTAARAKAQKLAESLQMRLGEPLVIYEDNPIYNRSGDPGSIYGNSLSVVSDDDESEDPTAIAPGAVVIRVRVHVTFRLKSA